MGTHPSDVRRTKPPSGDARATLESLNEAIDQAVVALTQARMACVLCRPHAEIRTLADEAARELHVARTTVAALLSAPAPMEPRALTVHRDGAAIVLRDPAPAPVSTADAEADLTHRARWCLADLSVAAKIAIEARCEQGKRGQKRFVLHTRPTVAIELFLAECIDHDAEPTELGREIARLYSEAIRGVA